MSESEPKEWNPVERLEFIAEIANEVCLAKRVIKPMALRDDRFVWDILDIARMPSHMIGINAGIISEALAELRALREEKAE